MKLIRTVKVRLRVAPAVFQATLQAYTDAFNFVCQTGWEARQSNGVSLHHLTYRATREQFRLKSQLAISARVKATEALSGVLARLRKGKSASCPVSQGCSVRYDDRSLSVNLATGIASILTLSGRISVSFGVPGYFKQYLAWTRKSSELFQIGDKTYLYLSFEKEQQNTVQTGQCLGVDRGVKNIAVTSNNHFFGGGQVRKLIKRYTRLRNSLQARRTHSARRHLAKLSQSERLARRDINHCVSKQIVSTLANGTTICLEKLNGIRHSARRNCKSFRAAINSWGYYQLAQFLTYKALARGCEVKYVDARFTSQCCSKCGYKHKNNRSGSRFRCKNCGFNLHADLNAARNIAQRHQGAISNLGTAAVDLPNGGNTNAPTTGGKPQQ